MKYRAPVNGTAGENGRKPHLPVKARRPARGTLLIGTIGPMRQLEKPLQPAVLAVPDSNERGIWPANLATSPGPAGPTRGHGQGKPFRGLPLRVRLDRPGPCTKRVFRSHPCRGRRQSKGGPVISRSSTEVPDAPFGRSHDRLSGQCPLPASQDARSGHRSVRRADPWVTKYIFPNSMLPSIRQIGAAIEDLFVVEDWHNFGADYDKTLMAWYSNVERHWESLKRPFDDRFHRMWTYYLLSCAGSFRARKNQLWQVVLSKHGVPNGYEAPRWARPVSGTWIQEPPRRVNVRESASPRASEYWRRAGTDRR